MIEKTYTKRTQFTVVATEFQIAQKRIKYIKKQSERRDERITGVYRWFMALVPLITAIKCLADT